MIQDPDQAYDEMRDREADAYDLMREEASEHLDDTLRQVFYLFYTKSPYYKGHAERLKNHMKNSIDWIKVEE